MKMTLLNLIATLALLALALAERRADWQIPDPRDMNEDDFRKVRELIRSKVAGLLAE